MIFDASFTSNIFKQYKSSLFVNMTRKLKYKNSKIAGKLNRRLKICILIIFLDQEIHRCTTIDRKEEQNRYSKGIPANTTEIPSAVQKT